MQEVCILLAGLVLSASAAAQQNEREGRREFGLAL